MVYRRPKTWKTSEVQEHPPPLFFSSAVMHRRVFPVRTTELEHFSFIEECISGPSQGGRCAGPPAIREPIKDN